MAALNFPLSPNDGDVHGNYVYDATEGVWNANPQQLASRFVTSATQPTSPSNGDGWLDTNTGKTYIYYNDGSSAQWIESGNPVIGFVDPYDQTTTSTGYLALPKGTGAQRPVAPENGDIRFNTELNQPEWYSDATDSWVLFKDAPTIDVEYLVIGGGAGGGSVSVLGAGGGGGAGGYRSSVIGESSGGGGSAESVLSIQSGIYTVTVGAGGSAGTSGSNSVFDTITSLGGGSGGSTSTKTPGSGGSGGGGFGRAVAETTTGATGTTGQGFDGGDALGSDVDPVAHSGGGGGGASSVGLDGSGASGGNGGGGVSSSITGSSVARAGGGGGGKRVSGTVGSATAGGGAGGLNTGGVNGTVNTGGGGGGAGENDNGTELGGAGGSGVVIIKYPSIFTATPSVGLTSITNTVGDYKVTTFTEGTGTVTFS